MWHLKLVKRSIIGLLILMVLLAAGLEVLSRIYQDKAAAFFRDKFSQQSDLVLQPFTTQVSVWTHFPNISFNLKNLSLIDTTGGKPVQVLGIKRAEIAIPLGQFDLERLQINRVDLIDVLYFQYVDSLGRKKGLRFKKIQNPDTTGSKLPFVIPRLFIRNARILSENQYKQSSFSFLIKEAQLQARLADQQLHITGNLRGQTDSLQNRQLVLFRNMPFTSSVQYAYNLNQKKGRLTNTSIILNQKQINVNGEHSTLAKGGANLNFKLNGRQPLLYLLTQLLPPQAKSFLSQVKTESDMAFVLHISGESGPMVSPRNRIKFTLKDGQFYLPANKTTISQVTLQGEMDNGALQNPETSRLTISEFSAFTKQDSFKVALEINNFLKPTFRFTGEGRMELANLAGFVKLPISRISGGSVVGTVHLTGTLPDSLQPATPDWQGRGSLLLEKATFRPVGLTVDCRKVNGGIHLKDNLLEIQELKGTLNGHPFKMQASVHNFLAYLFDQPGAITAKASVYAATLNTDWLDKKAMKGSGNQASKTKNPSDKQAGDSYRQASLRNIKTQVDLRVDNFHLPVGDKIKNLVVQVNQQDEKINLTRMRFTSSGGATATADGGFILNTEGIEKPFLNVQLNYPMLDLQNFMQHLTEIKELQKPASNTPTRKGTKTITRPKSDFLDEGDYRLNLQVKAGKIRYVHLNGTNLILRASLNSQRVKIDRLDFASSGGEIHMRGNMQLDDPHQNFPVRLRAELHSVNLQQLFAMAENMKLDVLGSKNIKGTGDCNITLITNLDQTFIPNISKITAYAKVTLRNMELIEVEPIQKALKILKKDRTSHLYFEDLTTNFILSNNQFLTPGLRMNSNLTTFNLSGTYIMGGGADLNMEVDVLNMLLANNKRRIDRIQSGDTTHTSALQNKQYLALSREQGKYKVNLSNRKQQEEQVRILKNNYQALIKKYQIDTVFSIKNQPAL